MTNETKTAPLPPFEAGHPHAEALGTIQHEAEWNTAQLRTTEERWHDAIRATIAALRASYLALLALDGRDAGRDAEDAARLDWLDAQTRERCVGLDGAPARGLTPTPSWFVHLNGIGYQPTKGSAREAIDAARAASAGGEAGR